MTGSDALCEFPATNGPCSNPATGDDGYCWLETHADDPADSEPDGRGAPEGNDNAATVEAYCESFVEDFLRDDEIERVEQFREISESPEGAATARLAAGLALEQFRRTGDDRFLRRYESICDTFGIAPADEVELSGDVGFDGEIVVDFEETDT